MPLTHNSLASLRFNGGQQAYRYDAPFPDTDPDTDLTRFSFFSTKLDIARNTLDKILYRAGGPKYPSRASTSRGANGTNPPNSDVSEVSMPTANGSAPNSSGTAISTCPAANGSRSDSTSTPSGPRTPGSRPKRLH